MEIEKKVLKLFEDKCIDLFLTLPCDRVKSLLSILPPKKTIELSREAPGVGISAGVHMAGKKPLMIIQNTGLGNSIIDLVSFAINYKIPLPIIISWRGVEGETIDAQKAFGNVTEGIIIASNIPYRIAEKPDDFGKISDIIDMSVDKQAPAICLIKPTFWEGSNSKILIEKRKNIPKRSFYSEGVDTHKIRIKRYGAIKAIVKGIEENDPDGLIICNLGIPCKELYEISHENRGDKNFYMLTGLGQASAIGFGVSLYSSKNVYVIDGDGSILHNPNIFDVITTRNPKNLKIFCIDNGVWGSTGNQSTHANNFIDLELIALSYGFNQDNTKKVYTDDEIIENIKQKNVGPNFFHTVVLPGNANVKNISLTCEEIKLSFMKEI